MNEFLNKKVLLADASSNLIKVAIFEEGKLLSKSSKTGGALENTFSLIDKCLKASQLKIKDINAMGFCEGTGSVLGIRMLSSALATFRALNPRLKLFTWSVLRSYSLILNNLYPKEKILIACPSRKNYANICICDKDFYEESEIFSSEIKDFDCRKFFIKQRDVDDINFSDIEVFSCDIEQIFETLLNPDSDMKIVSRGEIVDAKVLSKREYVKWNSQQHI